MATSFLDSYVFLERSDTVNISEIYSNTQGDTLMLNVEGSPVNISVEGKFDPESIEWKSLFAINATTTSVSTNNITVPGYHIVGIAGCREIRIKNHGAPGTVRVYAEVM